MKLFNKIISAFEVLINFFKIGFKLGKNLKEKFKFSFFLIFLIIKNHLIKKADLQTTKFHLKFLNQDFDFHFRHDSDDLGVLEGIFINEDYKIQLPLNNTKIIFDLGSHIGLSAIYLSSTYPQAKIFCFEPDPKNFAQLKLHTKTHSQIHIFNYAICSQSGKRKFYKHSQSDTCHSLVPREKIKNTIEVECLSLVDAMRLAQVDHIDLLKFDIEGAEIEIIKNFENPKMIRHFVGEIHPHLIKNFKENEFLNFFRNYQILLKRQKGKDAFILEGSSK